MATDRMALLTRLEQAARSSEPDVVREALGWAIEELLEIGGYEAGNGPTAQMNPLHPRVRDRVLGYLDALLSAFGNDLDAFVWDETYYVDPGQLGPASCPGYADRAFMRLVRELTERCHSFRADLAFLASDCIGPPGLSTRRHTPL